MNNESKNRYIKYTDELSENYKGTPLEGLDAFERQLKRFGIEVSGRNSENIEKFFEGNSTVKSCIIINGVVEDGRRTDIRSNAITRLSEIK